MGTTLDHGIYLPDEGERNCYDGLAGNWVALDNHLGSTNIHVTINDKQAWNGHVADSVKHVTAEDKAKWNGKADASALTAHTGNTTIHVTAEDKNKWDAVTSKADDSDVVHKSRDETISGNKTFSSINGVEPGSLSLPDLNNAVDISGYITDLAGSPNIYSPPANGYIALRSTTANVLGIVENTTGMGSFSRGSNQVLAVYLPVVKNSSISIYAICSSLTHAKFIPCLGNI